MPIYTYKAVNEKGETLKGSFEAASKSDLAEVLKKQGLTLVFAQRFVRKENGRFSLHALFKRVSLMDKLLFTRHLSTMISAGLALPRALKVLSEQTDNKYFKKVLLLISEEVTRGNQLSMALGKYPNIFDELFLNMTKVGEAGGRLEEVLKTIAEQLKKSHSLQSRVRGAMVYPAIILTAAIGVGILMMVVVVPKLSEVFVDLDIKLPLATRIFLGLSGFISNNLLLFLVFLVLVGLAARFFWKTKRTRALLEGFFFKIPLLGAFLKKVFSARFARSLGSLLESGVQIVAALEIASRSVGNVYYQESLEAVSKKVKSGEQLSACIAEFKNLYPPLVHHLISVGEETGTLTDVLNRLASFYEEDIDELTKNLSSIIEPILMILIGGVVGFFAISMIQPIYSVLQTF